MVDTPDSPTSGGGDGGDGQHPGNDYYVFKLSGTIQRAGGAFGKILSQDGWAGPFTWSQAKTYASQSTVSGEVNSIYSGIDEVGHVFDETYHTLADLYMWRSLGWLLLGVLLFGLAIWMFLRREGIA